MTARFCSLFRNNKEIKWFIVSIYRFIPPHKNVRSFSRTHKITINELLVMCCRICNHQIAYVCYPGQRGYHLVVMDKYHLHTEDQEKYLRFLNCNSRAICRFTLSLMDISWKVVTNSTPQQMLEFYEGIAKTKKQEQRFEIMKKTFGIDRHCFEELMARRRHIKYENFR